MTFFDRLLSSLKNERGAYMVFFAILIPILFGCAGLAVDLGNGFARHARLQKAADAAVLAAAYVYDEKNTAEMYRVAEQYLQANLDNEEDRKLSLDKIREKYDVKLYTRPPKDETKADGVLLSLDATETIGSKFIEFVGIHGFSVDVRATTKVILKKEPMDSGVFGYAFICGDRRKASQSGEVWGEAEKRPPFTLLNYKHKIIGKVHSNGAFGINGKYEEFSGWVESENFTTSINNDAELWKSRGEADWAHQNNKPMSDWYVHDQLINGKWYHYNRLGYFDKTGAAADVVAQDCYSPSLDISLSESNAKTKAIYDYVEDMRLHHSQGEEGVFVKTDGIYDQTVNNGHNKFEVWGQRFKTIIADGDISIYSNMIPADSKQPMAIISLHGNVNLWVDSSVKAVVYAPNGEINFEGIKTNGQTEYSFEGSMVGKRITLNGKDSGVGDYITYKWNDFNFGTADFGKPNSGSGGSSTGGSDSGTASVSSVILHKNEDSDYEEASSKNELKP